jgi:hypothetical protein
MSIDSIDFERGNLVNYCILKFRSGNGKKLIILFFREVDS